jgi:RNA polymerase sigma factor (sigma-70 family)
MDILALNQALEGLADVDSDLAKIVELRYFAGLTLDETADVLGTSPQTVSRDWTVARAWLARRLTAGDPPSLDTDTPR